MAKDLVELEDVTLEDLIPISTENGLTAWKFKFNQSILWLPMDSVDKVLPYAILYKIFSEIGIIDYSSSYEVFGDDVGIISRIVGTTEVDYSDSNLCIKKNMETSLQEYPNVNTTPTKKVGIFFEDSLANIKGDSGYSVLYIVTKGDGLSVMLYMFLSQLQFSSKSTDYIIDKLARCNDYCVLRYKKVDNNANFGQTE